MSTFTVLSLTYLIYSVLARPETSFIRGAIPGSIDTRAGASGVLKRYDDGFFAKAGAGTESKITAGIGAGLSNGYGLGANVGSTSGGQVESHAEMDSESFSIGFGGKLYSNMEGSIAAHTPQ